MLAMDLQGIERDLPIWVTDGEIRRAVKAVLCDLDGVIVNSEPYKYLSYVQVLVGHGIPLAVIEESRFLAYYKEHCVGKTREENAKAQLAFWKRRGYRLGLSWQDYAKERMRYYDPIKPHLPWIEENVACLRDLSQRYRVYLVSRTEEEEAKRIIDAAGLDRLIVAVAPTGNKYRPAIAAAARDGIPKEHCVAIEDTSDGVGEAKREDLFTLAIPNEFTLGQDFHEADIVAYDLAQCFEFK
jgi:beta-phosphoglucomutase